MDMKLELVPIPVTDVDRAKAFYADQLGFARATSTCVRPTGAGRPADAAGVGLLDRLRYAAIPAYEGRRDRSGACTSSSPTSRRPAPS